MTVLDTNVISEAFKIIPSSMVMRWLDTRVAEDTFTTSITHAEILYGLEILPQGKKRKGLSDSVERVFVERFEDRVLSFDQHAARAFATILAGRQRIGRPMSESDAMIAAIAKVNGASLATRNIADFEHCGIRLINPWTHLLH